MSSDVRFVMFFFGAFLIGLIAMIGKSVVDSNTSFANETAARLALARQYAAHRWEIRPTDIVTQQQRESYTWYSVPVNSTMHWFICSDTERACFEKQ